jgi:hypothetical protein
MRSYYTIKDIEKMCEIINIQILNVYEENSFIVIALSSGIKLRIKKF